MSLHKKTRAQLLEEIESLLDELGDLDEQPRALSRGEGGTSAGAEPKHLQASEGESPFRIMAEGMQEGAAILSQTGRVLYCNAHWRAMLKHSAGQTIGLQLADCVVKEQQESLEAFLRQTVLCDQGEQWHRLQFRLRAADGTPIPAQLSARAFAAEHSRGICVVLKDLREELRHEEAVKACREAQEQAEAANRVKDEFLASLSHELRTPLAPVLMSVSALETRKDLPGEVHAELSMVRRNVELETRLIDDLLDLTRISRGKLELSWKTVNARTLLQQTVEMCVAEASAKGLSLTLELQTGEHYLSADAARLQQVFWNLIKNAIKFTPAAGHIAVRCFSNGQGKVVVEVQDTGIGIASEVLPRLFMPFEQGGREMTRRYGGLGLGLAISRSLVELHGGILRAFSEGRGQGARFTVELPASEPPKAMAKQPDEPSDALSAMETGSLRILLVEDHLDTARTMAHLLESYGHTVRIAGGVVAALKWAGEEAFDLVIGDLGLPDGSGLDLMRDLKRQHGLSGIAISGYGMQDDIEKSREAGYLQHIIKPINTQKLEAVIRSVVRQVLPDGQAGGSGKRGPVS